MMSSVQKTVASGGGLSLSQEDYQQQKSKNRRTRLAENLKRSVLSHLFTP